ncbi:MULTISPECIES: CPBP family intramembrane glutamic endopeptidase [unclassified Arthrobacter]|uniref:CPBP family intramembrane glutamic endopeptidase n=1 Tax=unclassified Arthrobacter TaxID=235627 RepID=UPI0021065D52|nr:MULTISPECIES: CPBP family intramembrane glutamic endopeptidase [unclassified Arthrobacter]MCQ1945761.1 CPBP family intramembrane metalloprotease [Arthrobacter sp. zg-Y1116]MCQ1994580.1 CPBP family intramembrane metalloprotease [Arthrobacter sp. zg-Y1171]UWX81340.1 CPBP family intramembrane metalloprotease [Arthrobacter sp. zg-Y1171]
MTANEYRTGPPGRPAAHIPWLSYRFTRRDAVAAGFYVVFLLVLSFAPGLVMPVLVMLVPDPVAAAYVLNLAFYGVAGLLAFLAARPYVVRETKILATRPVLSLSLIPAGVLVMLIVTMIGALLSGQVETAVNQEAVEGFVGSVSPWLVVPLLVVLAPFVEEYIFRHLLIGKLSRYWNLWGCCILSVLLFASIHIVGKESLTLPVLMPYLAMGATLVGIYVWAGNNFMLSYGVHAAKNLLGVILLYSVPPELLQQ